MVKTKFTFNELKELLHSLADDSLPGHSTSSIFTDFSNRNQKNIEGAIGKIDTSTVQKAGVVLLIHERDLIPQLTFIKRSISPHDSKHSGQIAFPGGKQEPGETLRECAIREVEEEIGIKIMDETSLIQLTPFYVLVSNFMIYPFVCFQKDIGEYQIDPVEVDSVIEAPLTNLDINYRIFKSDMMVRNHHLSQVPYYRLGQHKLWGATAMIFTELLYILQNHSHD